MPTHQARGARGAVATGDVPTDFTFDLSPDSGAHVAQTIDPAADGCRTIVLTVDADAPAAPVTGRDPSILDGGLETTWVMPARARRFGRDDAAQHDRDDAARRADIEETVITLRPEAAAEAVAFDADEDLPAADHTPVAAERPRASFHATGDDEAVARVEADRREAGRRHAERRRRRAEAVALEPVAPVRRRSGPAPRAAAPAPGRVERHTVRISGTPDPLLLGGAGTALERRRPLAATMNPLAGLVDRPDRIAMWAVLLGIFLVLVAATSG